MMGIPMKYGVTIGMEVHVELKTASKMFCACPNGMGQEQESNVHICAVCSGQPGTLPVPNRAAIAHVQRAGLALNCAVAPQSKFDRKNYFYPDLPKGYQISQYDQPLCHDGHLAIGEKRRIGITRIHLEEDTGKLIHPSGASYSMVDLNRAGVPLMELVTEPDIVSGKEARLFCQELQQIFRYLDLSDADMEKGQMRCEVNISLYPEGSDRLSGTKVEIKNLNSFRTVERAIDFEIVRQSEVLEDGEKVVQETRGWDDVKQKTVSQRAKESAHDYRYFPEPDIPPLTFTEADVEELRRTLPELPDMKRQRFIAEYGLGQDNATVLTEDKTMADYFENVASEIVEKKQSGELNVDRARCITLAANYIVTELQKHLIKEKKTIRETRVTPENFAELVGMIADGKINSSAAQKILEIMHHEGGDPSMIAAEKNLQQVSDSAELERIVDTVVMANQKSVDDYAKGKQNAFQYLVGQVMAVTKGRANPKIVGEILAQKLSKKS